MPVRLPAIAILTDLYAQRAKEILDAKDADGCVPLHYAISEKHEATCDCLVELGASVEVGFAGFTAAQLCIVPLPLTSIHTLPLGF